VLRLRVAGPGSLRELESAFNQAARAEYDHLDDTVRSARAQQKKKLKAEMDAQFPDGRPARRRPQITSWRGYARETQEAQQQRLATGPFDPDFVILTKQEGNALGIESTLQLTGALRTAAMKAAGESPPEWLSGHTPDGGPTQSPHVALFPLAYVGFEHADGHIMGLGLAIPRGLVGNHDLRRVLGKLFFRLDGEPTEIRLWRAAAWTWTLERETRERRPRSLQRERWSGPSHIWASVTPVVLHHHPHRTRPGDVERIVHEAFSSALLPVPEQIRIQSVSAHEGAGHARSVPIFEEGGAGLCRYQIHVVVRFGKPVAGPVLVGRGRYRGYGLFAPLHEKAGEK
jgi:CRISPR-associated protein Csb2